MHIARIRSVCRDWQRLIVLLVVSPLVGVLGCGGRDPQMGQVEGSVSLDGNPVPSGKVIFQPSAGRGSIGLIQPDGTFNLGAEGAVVGEHKVAIVAFEPSKSGRPDPTAPRAPAKPIVPERYLAAGTSELTFEVKAGDNHAEFKLTSP